MKMLLPPWCGRWTETSLDGCLQTIFCCGQRVFMSPFSAKELNILKVSQSANCKQRQKNVRSRGKYRDSGWPHQCLWCLPHYNATPFSLCFPTAEHHLAARIRMRGEQQTSSHLCPCFQRSGPAEVSSLTETYLQLK